MTEKGRNQIEAILNFAQYFRTNVIILCRMEVQREILRIINEKNFTYARKYQRKGLYSFEFNGSKIQCFDKAIKSQRGLRAQMIMIDDYCNITEEEINKIIKPMCIYPFYFRLYH